MYFHIRHLPRRRAVAVKSQRVQIGFPYSIKNVVRLRSHRITAAVFDLLFLRFVRPARKAVSVPHECIKRKRRSFIRKHLYVGHRACCRAVAVKMDRVFICRPFCIKRDLSRRAFFDRIARFTQGFVLIPTAESISCSHGSDQAERGSLNVITRSVCVFYALSVQYVFNAVFYGSPFCIYLYITV